jgi:hypothetical protein
LSAWWNQGSSDPGAGHRPPGAQNPSADGTERTGPLGSLAGRFRRPGSAPYDALAGAHPRAGTAVRSSHSGSRLPCERAWRASDSRGARTVWAESTGGLTGSRWSSPPIAHRPGTIASRTVTPPQSGCGQTSCRSAGMTRLRGSARTRPDRPESRTATDGRGARSRSRRRWCTGALPPSAAPAWTARSSGWSSRPASLGIDSAAGVRVRRRGRRISLQASPLHGQGLGYRLCGVAVVNR